MEGFISLHRKFLSWEWHDNPNVVAVWVHLLLTANYVDKEWHGITIKRGQVLTSMASLARTTGITPKQARNCISKLCKTGELLISVINIKGANHRANLSTLITICNYDVYQNDECSEGQTNGQSEGKARASTNKDNNIYKEDNKLSSMSNSSPSTLTEQVDFNAFKKYWNDKMRDKAVRSIISISTNRKKMIHARVAEYGKEALMKVVEKTSASRFLNGDNTRGFIADFGWVIRPTNFLKILEGNYDNR